MRLLAWACQPGASRALVRAANQQGQDAFRGNGKRTAQEQEIADLRRRVKQLEEEKEILKKCMAPPPESTTERVTLA